jgi:hypothetical protein
MSPFARQAGADPDAVDFGRRAAAGMDVTRVVDRTLELLFAAADDPQVRETLSMLRVEAQAEKHRLIDSIADIYAEVYAVDELKALVAFLEGPAGRAMRAKQGEVEARVQHATTAFLQDLALRSQHG